jgi:hypothetical protein
VAALKPLQEHAGAAAVPAAPRGAVCLPDAEAQDIRQQLKQQLMSGDVKGSLVAGSAALGAWHTSAGSVAVVLIPGIRAACIVRHARVSGGDHLRATCFAGALVTRSAGCGVGTLVLRWLHCIGTQRTWLLSCCAFRQLS